MPTYQGIICNAFSDTYEAQIEIDPQGCIAEVRPMNAKGNRTPDRTFDKSCIIFPGMVDVHIHAREDKAGTQNYKEEYRTALNAAQNGGVVAVGAMGNTPTPNLSDETYDWHRRRIAELNHPVALFNYIMIMQGTRPLAHDVAYKAMLAESVGGAYFRTRQEVRDTLQYYKGKNISFHVEDQEELERNKNGRTHTERRPRSVINASRALLLPLIEEHEIEAKLCHWTTGGECFTEIAAHRGRMQRKNLGYNTSLEVSPMHLLFDCDMLAELPELWPIVQMNPAQQSRDDRIQLIDGLRSGFINHLATDHAPHTLQEKFKQFEKFKEQYPNMNNEQIYLRMLQEQPELCKTTCCENGMSGAPWLDTYAAVTTMLMKEHNFMPQDIARCASFNPGKFANRFLGNGYGKGFGKIAPGFQGSLTVLNLDKPMMITRDLLQTKCGWSPLENRVFPGSLEAPIIRGKDMTGRFMH